MAFLIDPVAVSLNSAMHTVMEVITSPIPKLYVRNCLVVSAMVSVLKVDPITDKNMGKVQLNYAAP